METLFVEIYIIFFDFYTFNLKDHNYRFNLQIIKGVIQLQVLKFYYQKDVFKNMKINKILFKHNLLDFYKYITKTA